MESPPYPYILTGFRRKINYSCHISGVSSIIKTDIAKERKMTDV